MALHAIRGKTLIGTILVLAAGLTAGGVALASTPGTTTAAAAPRVFVASHTGNFRAPFFKPVTIGTLSLPAGAYTVTAKAWMTSVAGAGNSSVWCKLTLGANTDQAQADAQDGNPSTGTEPVRNEMLYLTASGSIGNGVKAKLICENFGHGNTDLKFIKITALKVGSVTRSTF